MALSPCQEQHQEVWMGEEGRNKEGEANLMLYNSVSPLQTYLLTVSVLIL